MSRHILAMPAAAIAETFPRGEVPITNLAVLATGRLQMVTIVLPQDVTLNSISVLSGLTGIGVPTHQWFALYNLGRTLLRATSDDLTTAWAANSIKTLALSSPYTVTAAGLYYLGIMVTATTVPTLLGFSGSTVLNGLSPILVGTANTGLGALPAPSPANALSVVANTPYAYVS